MLACREREAMVMAPPLHMTRQYLLASMAAGFPPQAFPTTVSSLTSPWSVSPQSTASLAQGLLHNPKLQLLLLAGPSRGPVSRVCVATARSLIPFRLPQVSCFTLSLKCFFSNPDNSPDVGIGSLLQLPNPLRASPVLLTLLLFPPSFLSYWVLRGSVYSFPLLRYPGLFSSGVLPVLLCLTVYSWCICGERCTPRLPTPPPSCSLHVRFFATPCTVARQASLSITNSQSLLKLMSIESVMPFNHLILCHPPLLLPSIFPSISLLMSKLFASGGQKYWSFSFSISPSNVYSRLIFFRIDLLDLLAVQGTLKCLPNTAVQRHQFLSAQPSLWYNS